MSGGVDSSVVAALLQKQGYEVIGVTLHLYDNSVTVGKTRTCCSIDDVYDAQAVANCLGINHYILDREDEFKKTVINEFISEYLSGSTPIPCATCNRSVKIKEMVKFANSIGVKYVATGHYVNTEIGKDGVNLFLAKDSQKDQTYFLSLVNKEDINRLICPLGLYSKAEVRKIASNMGLTVDKKKDSQDICFVPNGNYVDVIRNFSDVKFLNGSVIHIQTKEVLGEHNGLVRYTVGQRKGIRISYKNPLYVCKIDTKNNILFVGEEHYLYSNKLLITQFNLLTNDINDILEGSVSVKIRASSSLLDASISLIPDKKNNLNNAVSYNNSNINSYGAVTDNQQTQVKRQLFVSLASSGRGIAPGQVCAVYKKNQLLGGGKIKCLISE